jgi:hypothetical protein
MTPDSGLSLIMPERQWYRQKFYNICFRSDADIYAKLIQGKWSFHLMFQSYGTKCKQKNFPKLAVYLKHVEWMTEFQPVARIATWRPWNKQVISEVTSWNETFFCTLKRKKNVVW